MSCVMASEIAELLNGKVVGKDKPLYGISLLRDASPERLVIMYENQINADVCAFEFGAVVLPPRFMLPIDKTFIISSERIWDKLYKIVNLFLERGVYQRRNLHTPINRIPCEMGRNCLIGENVRFGERTRIGNDCIIGAGTVIGDDVIIGNGVTVESGAVIGNESYQYCRDEGILYKVPNIGTVIVGDNVEIGANSTIDRGTIGNTVIGNGTKIGNLVQVGHETIIGDNCMIVAQTGISAWAEIGNGVTVYGQAGITNFVHIGDNAIILAKSGVSKNVPDNSVMWGIPAEKSVEFMRKQAFIRMLYRRRKNDE